MIKIPNKICIFFGHRNTSDAIRPALYTEIEKHITDYGVTTFYHGGKGSFDWLADSVLQELKKKYPSLKIYQILYKMPGKKENEPERDGRETMYPDGLETAPPKFAITKRNKWMVQECTHLIACVRFTWGGAYDALELAKQKKKQTVNLAEPE